MTTDTPVGTQLALQFSFVKENLSNVKFARVGGSSKKIRQRFVENVVNSTVYIMRKLVTLDSRHAIYARHSKAITC